MSTPLQKRSSYEMDSLLSSVKGQADGLLTQGQGFVDRVFPPEQRSALWARLQAFASAHPKIAAFLLCQIALSGIPLLLFVTFTVTVFVFSLLVGLVIGLVGALLFTGFMVLMALFFLLPTLFITTMAGTFTFIWGFGGFYLLRWFNSGTATAQGKAVGDKLNNLSGGRLNSLMDAARETARKNAPAKQINGSKAPAAKPRKLKQEDRDSEDEKSSNGSNGFTMLSQPLDGDTDDVNISATTNIEPLSHSNRLGPTLGTKNGAASGISGRDGA